MSGYQEVALETQRTDTRRKSANNKVQPDIFNRSQKEGISEQNTNMQEDGEPGVIISENFDSSKNDEDESQDQKLPKCRLLDRSQLMDMMLFPQNCSTMIIVPSNKEGTGFLNHCYDSKFLTGFITKKEFNALILICSKIAARAYSQKQLIDHQKTSQNTIWYIALSTVTAIAGLVFIIMAAIYRSKQLNNLSSVFLGPSILMVMAMNIYTWRKKQPDPLTFNKMVKSDMDEFFEKVNSYYQQKTNQGIQFNTIEGHFWIEIHIDQDKKLPTNVWESEEFKKQSDINLDYILNLARLTTRGKNMLMRDLVRMEQASDEENESEDQDE